MFLDIGESIFIWIGAKSNKDEALLVEKLIPGYLQSDPTGRDADTTILKIRQGCEPPTFTGFFGVWDPTCWEVRLNRKLLLIIFEKCYVSVEPIKFRENKE